MGKVDKKEKKVKDAKPAVKKDKSKYDKKLKEAKKDVKAKDSKKDKEVKKSSPVKAKENGITKKSKKAAPPPPPKPESSSESGDSDSEDSDDEEPPKKVAPVPAAKAESSDESSEESESEDEKPKAAQVTKPAPPATSDSDSDSDSDTPAPKPTPAPTPAKAKGKPAAAPLVPTKKDESSGDSDSDEDSDSEEAKPAAKAAATSSDSDDSDSDDEPAPVAKKQESSDSSDSSDDDSDVDMEDAAPVTTNGKRKATDDAPVPPKKVKLANGDAAPATSGETEGTNIFVGQLSWNVDDERFAAEFAECGEVLEARVQMDRNTGKSRGFGYLTFATPEGAKKALAMSGKEIDGRAINVDVSTPRPPRDANGADRAADRARKFNDQPSEPSSTLFVGNLSFDANEDNVWEFFSEHGVKSVRLPTDRDTGRPKGFGYVEFESLDGAKAAFESSKGAEFAGRAIRLDYSQPKDSSGGSRGGFGGDRGGGRGFGGGRGRGGDRGGRGFGGRGGGDRGFGGRGRGRGGDRGGRGRGGPNPRTGGIMPSDSGKKKITF